MIMPEEVENEILRIGVNRRDEVIKNFKTSAGMVFELMVCFVLRTSCIYLEKNINSNLYFSGINLSMLTCRFFLLWKFPFSWHIIKTEKLSHEHVLMQSAAFLKAKIQM